MMLVRSGLSRIYYGRKFYDYPIFFSTRPVNELIAGINGADIPRDVKRVVAGLPFRDFITVGILADRLKIKNQTDKKTKNSMEYVVSEKDNIWKLSDKKMAEFDTVKNTSDE